MKIYIAGKITGLDYEEAESRFMFAETVIEKAGHTPLNPLKLVDQAAGRRYEEYLLDALRILMIDADAVYMLDNWRESRGACIEFWIAGLLGKPISFVGQALPGLVEIAG